MRNWVFSCTRCGQNLAARAIEAFCPKCGGVLQVEPVLRLNRAEILLGEYSLWRYASCLPVSPPPLTRGEGMTPLVPGELDGERVWFKLDFLLPSGSFKDRGAAVLVWYLVQRGVPFFTVDSSGNAAAAFAAYAALHQQEARIFAPQGTAVEKLLQVRAYGARLELVKGSREEVAAAAQEAARQSGGAYVSHNWHPLFAEGTKTWLLEVWEQLGCRWPEACFLPVGGGSLLLGAVLAVRALGESGPRLVAAQPEACAPLVQAYWQGTREVEPVRVGTTLAEGARIANPPRGSLLLAALRQSLGWAEAVPEPLLIDTLRLLWWQGFFVEPTAALGAAAYRLARRRGWQPTGDVVVVLTGSGLKTSNAVALVLEGQR